MVKQLHTGRAPGDKICSKFLDILELSWLTHLSNIAWSSAAVSLDWQAGVVVPIFKKVGPRMCSSYRGITLFGFHGKVYARVLERRVHSLVKPRIQEEQCSFRRSCGTVDQLSILPRLLEGVWEFG